MREYATEIHVPADRRVILQLPDDYPEGPSLVAIRVANNPDVPAPLSDHSDELHDAEDDIEWWEEFEAEDGYEDARGDKEDTPDAH